MRFYPLKLHQYLSTVRFVSPLNCKKSIQAKLLHGHADIIRRRIRNRGLVLDRCGILSAEGYILAGIAGRAQRGAGGCRTRHRLRRSGSIRVEHRGRHRRRRGTRGAFHGKMHSEKRSLPAHSEDCFGGLGGGFGDLAIRSYRLRVYIQYDGGRRDTRSSGGDRRSRLHVYGAGSIESVICRAAGSDAAAEKCRHGRSSHRKSAVPGTAVDGGDGVIESVEMRTGDEVDRATYILAVRIENDAAAAEWQSLAASARLSVASSIGIHGTRSGGQ